MQKIKPKLKKYIEEEIFPQYKNNIQGHNIDHIYQVITRSFELIQKFDLDVNPNLVYTIAAFHDLGYKIDPDNHEQVSSELFLQDDQIKKFFTKEEIDIIAIAIVDHRASLEYEARNIYGKIVSSADREISVENILKRSYLFQKDKHKNENPKEDEIIEYSYQKLSSKYGKDGYAKMYFPDQKYQDFLKEMHNLIADKNEFIKKEKSLKL